MVESKVPIDWKHKHMPLTYQVPTGEDLSMRNTGKKKPGAIVVHITLAVLLPSCSAVSGSPMDNSIRVPGERIRKPSSDSLDTPRDTTSVTNPRQYVQLTVKNEVPFTRRIFQLLDSLGVQLEDNPGNLKLVLNMTVAANHRLQMKEEITGDLNAVE